MDLRKVGYMGRLVPVGWGEAHHSWRIRMTSIYPIIRKLKIMCYIMYETQSMIHCANIPHEFATGGLHPTLQERGLSIECLIHDRWKYVISEHPSSERLIWR
jgi:hypothetical protein